MHPNVLSGPGPGYVLDERYYLMERLPAVAGRPRYLAEDLVASKVVDVVITGEETDGTLRYAVRPSRQPQRKSRGQAVGGARRGRRSPEVDEPRSGNTIRTALPPAPDAALRVFVDRVHLTQQVPSPHGTLAFEGYDRGLGQPVRILVVPRDGR
ncbi:MAG: hypothetical protein IT371_11220 [Deltaproteobacteria bacterium]|nr:hypothetical protein [Deltaproteobacteria bacterium]